MQAILLGSGMSDFVNHFEIKKEIPYDKIVSFPYKPIDGHERILYLAHYRSQDFIILSGRFHRYEGLGPNEISSIIAFAKATYKLERILVCSAAGALSKEISIGEWHQISDFICFPQIPGLVSSKNLELLDKVKKTSYAYHQGPSLGTNAEYKILHNMGCGLVGMSMLPELTYLIKNDLSAYFLSLAVCQYQPFDQFKEPGHEQVIKIASEAIPSLVNIFKNLIA